MGQPIQRLPKTAPEPARRVADRARLLERIAAGLAHEGKNPLHNMALHVQLLAEKIAAPSIQGSPIEKHLAALRDGIGRVDHLLRAFGEFTCPEHLPADLGAALNRCEQLFAYEARRASVQIQHRGPPALLVASDSRLLGDLVAHALVACIEYAREQGCVDGVLELRGQKGVLELHADGGPGNHELALPHLEALRDLAPDAACELSIETPAAGGARLSLSFLHPR
jgi:signal transduction histidine kinase